MADYESERYRGASPPRRVRSRSPVYRREERYDDDRFDGANSLYIAGLSPRVTERDLLAHFEREGKVTECRLVTDPRTHESRGFGFVTMAEPEDAEACIKYLHRSTLEGRVIIVERAKRRRARTPTPGQYLGARRVGASGGGGGSSGGGRYGGDREDGRSYRRSYDSGPYPRGGRERSPPPSGGYRRGRSPSPRGRDYDGHY